MTIETYPMMNAMITDILRTDIGDKVSLYAAQRIEEQVAEVERLQVWRELWNEVIDAGCWNNDGLCRFCGMHHSESHGDDCLFDRADTIMASEIMKPVPNALPCGHPRSAVRGDVSRWCIECEKEGWRVGATLDRLISNIPAACEILREHGKANLAFRLCQDQSNLVYWQEHGGLMEATDDH